MSGYSDSILIHVTVSQSYATSESGLDEEVNYCTFKAFNITRIGSNYNSNILLSLTTSLKQISNNQPGSSGEMKLPDSISDHRANISIIISNPAPRNTFQEK